MIDRATAEEAEDELVTALSWHAMQAGPLAHAAFLAAWLANQCRQAGGRRMAHDIPGGLVTVELTDGGNWQVPRRDIN